MRFRPVLLFALAVSVASVTFADVRTFGDIEGTVQSDDHAVLPGASVTLTGEGLIQKSITVTSGANGVFRFTNIKPGHYTVTVSLAGFATEQLGVTVSVGKVANVPTTLHLQKTSEAVMVHAEAPIIDKTSPQITTNYSTKLLEELPTTRNYIDVLESAPTVTDRSAYGAGGNVEGYDIFGFGAATNLYNVNGVAVNALEFGNTWVNPNMDTIAELQVVGPGASAEYGNYTGATINIVTKAGTNDFHGSVAGWYTSDKLTADNSGGIADLQSQVVKDKWEGAGTFGGPIVKEKLLFFVGIAAYGSQTAPFADPTQPPAPYIYNDQKRQSYQIRLDYLLNNSNTIFGMYNRDPIKETDDGLLPCCGPEIGYSRDWNTNTGTVAWQSIWSPSTTSELKAAAVQGTNYRIPVAPLNVPAVYDYRVGFQQFNSTGFQRLQANNRYEGIGTVTHYLDKFLGGAHDLKFGVEYEHAQARTQFILGGNEEFVLYPYNGATNYLEAVVNYNVDQRSKLERPAAFVNDTIHFGRLTANVGLRYDHPAISDLNTGKDILVFNNWSPRIGFSYDILGDGTTVAHAAYGRYYEKVPTYGPGFYSGVSGTPTSYYSVFTDHPPAPTDWPALEALIVQPQNLFYYFSSTAVPVQGGTKNPLSDVISASIERQLGPRTAVSLSFVAKEEKNYLGLLNTNNPQFVPYHTTVDFSGNPPPIDDPTQWDGTSPPLWNIVGALPDQKLFGNVDFLFQHQRLLTAEIKSNPTSELRVNASFTYEHTRGNYDNNECAALALCTNFRADNPNFSQNPYQVGDLSAVHKYQVKVYGYYHFPWDITLGTSYRWLSGTPWGATVASYRIPGFHAAGFYSVPLEPKDARHQPGSHLLDLQLSKSIVLSNVTVTALCSVTNVTNTGYQTFDYYNNDPYGTYTYQFNADGTPVSNFGKPQNFNSGPPRVTRFGLRVTF